MPKSTEKMLNKIQNQSIWNNKNPKIKRTSLHKVRIRRMR